MIITIVQTDITWANPADNRMRIEEMTSSQTGDLFILPEMFSTGFATQPEGIAEEDGSTLAWMKEMAAHKQAAIVAVSP